MVKASFWNNQDFHGVDLRATLPNAKAEYFRQPVVGSFPLSSLLSDQRAVHSIDFNSVTLAELQVGFVTVPLNFLNFV